MQDAATGGRAAAPAAAGHDPANPPVDCPLRRHGVDQASLRPFEDVESYVAFPERPDRAAWQRPEDVLHASVSGAGRMPPAPDLVLSIAFCLALFAVSLRNVGKKRIA